MEQDNKAAEESVKKLMAYIIGVINDSFKHEVFISIIIRPKVKGEAPHIICSDDSKKELIETIKSAKVFK